MLYEVITLDPIAEAALYDEYAKMTKGKTSIYISHRLRNNFV